MNWNRRAPRWHWKADPEDTGGGGSPSPDAGGEDPGGLHEDAAAPPSEKEDKPDPYLTDPRLHPSLRAKPSQEDKPEGTPPAVDAGDEDDFEYSEKVRRRVGKEVLKTKMARDEAERERKRAEALQKELEQLRAARYETPPSQPAPRGYPPVPAPMEEQHAETPLNEDTLLRYDANGAPLKPKEEDFIDEETGMPDLVRLAEAHGAYGYESKAYKEQQSRRQLDARVSVAKRWEDAEQEFKAQAPDYEEVLEAAAPLFFETTPDGQSRPKRESALLIAALTDRMNPALVYRVNQDETLAKRLLGLQTRPEALMAALDHLEGALVAGTPARVPASPGQARPPSAPRTPPPPVPPRMPHGSRAPGEGTLTESMTKGKSPQWMRDNDARINASINAGTFYGR